MRSILVVDDDLYIGNLLEEALTKEGYKVSRAYSGTEAILVLDKNKTDLVLLDLMLPGLNGEEILPRIQNIPVIVVSAKADVDNKINLLLSGAQDYITKPFNIKELLARIRVQLRKKENTYKADSLSFKGITLSLDTHIVNFGKEEIKLTKTEFAILKVLMENQDRIVTKSRLLDLISYDTPDCSESSLKMHISNLRKKLKTLSDNDYIEAVWGIGFKMKD